MSYTEKIYGSIPALITPFKEGGEIDLTAYKNLLYWHVDKGTHGVVICGTTGESANITKEEHRLLLKTAIEDKQVTLPIIAGCGTNSTTKTIELTKQAQDLDADAALIVVPYYNKPTQEGLFQHFKAIHDATDIPIILYNVPSRTITDMDDETIIRLAQLPRIIGIKDATGYIDRLNNQRQHINSDFVYLSGDDMSAAQYMANGGHGCISVSANVIPEQCAEICNLSKNGQHEKAIALNNELFQFHQAMFTEPSPAVPKYILAQQSKINNVLRLPLLKLSDEAIDAIAPLIDKYI